jgi:hypothetical protein
MFLLKLNLIIIAAALPDISERAALAPHRTSVASIDFRVLGH